MKTCSLGKRKNLTRVNYSEIESKGEKIYATVDKNLFGRFI